MRSHKVSYLLQALILGAVTSAAAAQTVVVTPAPAPYVTYQDPSVVVVQADSYPPSYPAVLITNRVAVQPSVDPVADSKCRFVVPASYWGCVNSHNGGG